MKKYVYLIAGIVIICLSVCLWHQFGTTKKYKALYEKELQNVNAYQVANSGLEGEIRSYKMTIDDLYASKDSLDVKLVNTMHDLDLANSKIKNMQYQLSQASKVDTITLHDTIFSPGVSIDTTIGDYWYTMRLQMEYPATVVTEPTFNSEQFVYIYNRKEYVGGKSKCFFINWFKKTYTVTDVKIEEKNPYINTTVQKFIEVE